MPVSSGVTGVAPPDLYISLPGSGLGIVAVSASSPSLIGVITPQPHHDDLLGDYLPFGSLPFSQSSTGPKEENIYIELPGSGVGIYSNVPSTTPDLCATIQSSIPSTTLDSTIQPTVPADLFSIIFGFGEGEDSLSGVFIRGLETEDLNLQAEYFSTASGAYDLSGVIRPIQSGSGSLPSEIYPIPPVDLFANITGNSFEDLIASVSPVPPVDLPAQISGQPFTDLYANLQGFDELDLFATITGNSLIDLPATITGLVSDSEPLFAEINADDLYRLFCTISGIAKGEGTLSGFYEAVPPVELSGFYEAVPPVELSATLSSVQLPETLTGEITGIFRQDQLLCQITATGGFFDLQSWIFPSTEGNLDLSASIDPAGALSLSATINNDPQDTLTASITAGGPFGNTQISGQINAVQNSDLMASIFPSDSPFINASYNPVPGHFLGASIFPDVFYIDALIPINTYAFKEMTATINADLCNPRSDLTSLVASYVPIFKDDLSAQIIGATNFVKAADLLRINFSKQHVFSDKLLINLGSPSIATDYLKLLILNSPYGDLGASIFGVQASSDLSATISSQAIGSFYSADPSEGIWVNTKTGQRKIIRFFFSLTGKTYYYSEVSDRTFPENIKDSIKLIVETHDPIEEDENIAPTMMATREKVRQCVVSDLSCFNSWDEAVRYGIWCAAGPFENLTASILPTGGSNIIRGRISPLDDDNQRRLPAKIVPVKNLPDLGANIQPTGGFADSPVTFIRPFLEGFTVAGLPATELNDNLAPIMITFGTGSPQLILQNVISTGNLILSSTPGLTAEITGVVEDELSAVISGV